MRMSDWSADVCSSDLILQTGADKHPELQSLPRMIDLARTDDERKLLTLFASPSTVGRSVVAPPGLPPARVTELRRAFMSAIESPALLADVKRDRTRVVYGTSV